MKARLLTLSAAVALGLPATATAEIVSSAPDHFTLKLEAQSDLSPADMWTRLIEPADWWLSDHSYSGDSSNLSLDPQAGGLWREDWEGARSGMAQSCRRSRRKLWSCPPRSGRFKVSP